MERNHPHPALLILGLLLAAGCDRSPRPATPPPPAPAPAQQPAPAPQALPPAPRPTPEPTRPTPAPHVKVKEPEAPRVKVSVPVIEEASPYLTTTYVLEIEGLDCRNDGGAWMALVGSAMADSKRKALDRVLGDIRTRTKNPELRRELLAAYNNATLDTRMLRVQQKPDPERGSCCVALCRVEIRPDPARMGKLLRK